MRQYVILAACCLLALAGMGQAQTFNTTGTTTVSLSVVAEAAISVGTAATALTGTAGNFANPWTGSTALTYKIRTTKTGGTGSITAKVTTDFAPAGGPSVGTPPTAGDALTYTCTVTSPGTACSGAQTAAMSASTPVATFGAGAKSAAAGNTASVAWSLTNDPVYDTGSFTATVTFTISAA